MSKRQDVLPGWPLDSSRLRRDSLGVILLVNASRMAEHLVVVSSLTLKRLLHRPTLTWMRRRREAPVGRVRAGDHVFFKGPGGLVTTSGTVARVQEARKGGRYVLTLRFRGLKKLSVPFPVVKRDRRSWVVCSPPMDASQQRLLIGSAPTVHDLLRAVRTTRRRLPSPRVARALLASFAREPRSEGALILWLAMLIAAPEADRVTEVLREYVRKPASTVVPFAVFS